MNTIPESACEVILGTWETGARKTAHYYLDGQLIGYRSWTLGGIVDMEYRIADGIMHGAFRTWHENGQLSEEAWYVHGKEHGTTKQYDDQGPLLGTYTMEHGTGIDLYFAQDRTLSEERSYRDGQRHGYERWWNSDEGRVWQEDHYRHGQAHGIFRQWNEHGRLRRGYPRYFVAGQRASKRQYERARRSDASLPPIDATENSPERPLPVALARVRDRENLT